MLLDLRKIEQIVQSSHVSPPPFLSAPTLFPLLLLFSCSIVPDSSHPHGLQHARLPCPSSSSGVCWNSCPLSRWCHPTISSFCPLHLLPSIFPSFWVFSVSRLFASGGQSIGASACFPLAFCINVVCGSVQFSCPVTSDSLWPHGLQHARLPCPSLAPGVYSNSCPLIWWCHPIVSSLSSPSSAFNLSQC